MVLDLNNLEYWLIDRQVLYIQDWTVCSLVNTEYTV